MKKLLIVGGTGFIGYHTAKKALKSGWEVTSFSLNKPIKQRHLNGVKYVICDISKKKNLEKKIKESFTFVINLGGYIDHTNDRKIYKSHFEGLKNLCEIFSSKKIKTFIQIGSSVEYGNQKSPHLENKNKITLKSNYAKAKFFATKLALDLYKKKKFPIVVLRLYQVYGPRQKDNRLIPSLIKSCLNKKNFPCTDGSQLRDFVYINDVVSSFFKCYDNKKTYGQIFNIGSGKPKKIKSIINLIKNQIGFGLPEFGKIKIRSDENSKLFPNINKAKKLLRWSPKINLQKGIKYTIQDLKSSKYSF